MKLLTRFLIICILITTIFGNMVVTEASNTSAATQIIKIPSDIHNHWAEKQIAEWVNNGLIKGYSDGTFKPDNSITRAEFAVIVNRIFGYTRISGDNFSDVSARDWFANDVKRSKAAGYILGTDDGKFLPNNKISRQEAAEIIFRILELEFDKTDALSAYTDAGSISDSNKAYVNTIIAKEYMKGYSNKTFGASKYMTRAEVVAALDRVAGKQYSSAGSYGSGSTPQEISGNVTINTANVTLTNMVIDGGMYLAESIGNGEITLDNVTVKGKVLIKGGGSNSIKIKDSKLGQVVVDKKDGVVRVVCIGNTSVGKVDLKSGTRLEESELTGAGFEDITIGHDMPAGSIVQLVGDFNECMVDSSVTVQILRGSVSRLTISESAPNTKIKISGPAKIVELIVNSAATITGNGKIVTASINAADTSIENAPYNVNIKTGITAVIAGNTVTNGWNSTNLVVSGSDTTDRGIVIDGDDSDWIGIAPLQRGVGDVESISAKVANERLYVMVKGSGIGLDDTTGYLEMDTDMSSSTGYISWNWADCGIDFLLMKEYNDTTQIYEMKLYSHPQNNSDWDWTYIATANAEASPVEYAATDDIVEISIDVKALNYNQKTLGLAYMADDYNLVPEKEYGLVEVVGPKEPAETSFTDSLTDWTGVSPIASGTGYVSKLYAKQDETKLYIRAEGISHLSKVANFFIDTDNSSATGYNSANWLNSGVDYEITDNKLFKYTGDGGSWAWQEVNDVSVSRGATASEMAVNLSDLALTGPSNMKVSFYLQGGSLAPAKGGTIARLTAENPAHAQLITIDGNVSDWEGFNAKALASYTNAKEGSLYAVQDGEYLYVLIKGSALEGQNFLLIDSDNDKTTGFANQNWSKGDTGFNYNIDINTGASLCRFAGVKRGDWTWNPVAGSEVSINKTNTQIEMRIKLSDIGLNGTTPVKLGFWANNGSYLLPSNGVDLSEPPATVNPAVPKIPSVGITVDGNSAEWDKNVTLISQSVSGAVYAAEDSQYLYLLAEGAGLTSEHYFYLDIDMDNTTTTGFSSAVWTNPGGGYTGIDYFITPADIQHQTTNGIWGFTSIGKGPEFAENVDDTVIEERIKLSDIGLDGPVDIRIGYRGTADTNVIPASGPLTSVLTAPAPAIQPLNIAIDGDINDWSGIEALDSYSVTYSTYALQDSDYLYMYVKGAGFDQGQTYFFIDSDNNNATGLTSANWLASGADYIVDNSTLKVHVDSDPNNRTNWDWTAVEGATVEIAKTANITEMRVKLKDLGLTGPSEIKLSFWGNEGAVLLPVMGTPMAALENTYLLSGGIVPQFEKIPNAIGLAIDDTGWMGGHNLWNSSHDPKLPPDGPGRLCVDRDPQLSDYQTVVDIGEAVNSRLLAAFVMSEFDKNNILAQDKYNTAAFNITEYGKNWTNSDYSGTVEKNAKLDEFTRYFYNNASYMEFGLHGVRHARFANEPKDGGGTEIIQSDAEWGPITDVYVSKVPYTQEELGLKAQAFEDILRQYFTIAESSFPKSMVPPRHGWVYSSKNDPTTGKPYTFTTGKVLNSFGVKYANGDARIDTDLGDGGIDNGVLFINRQYGADFYAIGDTPNVMPMAYGKLGWIESHFPNLWDAKDKWVTYLNTINDHPYRYLPRNTEQLSSQWLYMKYSTIRSSGDGKTFTIDTANMPEDAYTYDVLGTLVIKTPLQGKHISSASITSANSADTPQITGYYEDDFGYGYLEIADGGNTMGRLDRGIYTLTCMLGDGYMDAYTDFTKGTFNVYSFDCQANSATIKLEMYGTQDVKIKLPFAPNQAPVSDNANLKVNSWKYENGYLIMNIKGVDMQGETGNIIIN